MRRIELVHGLSGLFAVAELAGVWAAAAPRGGHLGAGRAQPAHCVTMRRPDHGPTGDARPCHSGPPRTGCRGAGKHLRLAPEAPIARPDRCGAWASRPTRRHRAVCRPRPPTLPAPLTGARCACVAQSPHNDTDHHTTTQTRATTQQRQQDDHEPTRGPQRDRPRQHRHGPPHDNRTTTTQDDHRHHRPTTPTKGPPEAHQRPTRRGCEWRDVCSDGGYVMHRCTMQCTSCLHTTCATCITWCMHNMHYMVHAQRALCSAWRCHGAAARSIERPSRAQVACLITRSTHVDPVLHVWPHTLVARQALRLRARDCNVASGLCAGEARAVAVARAGRGRAGQAALGMADGGSLL